MEVDQTTYSGVDSMRASADVAEFAVRPCLHHVVVLESLPLFAEGLARLLRELADIHTFSTTSTISNLKALLKRTKPELVIVDADAQGGSPLDVTKWVRRHAADTKLVFLAGQIRGSMMARLRAGPNAVLLKSASPGSIRTTLLHVLAGEQVVSPLMEMRSAAKAGAARPTNAPPADTPLSRRERQVLSYTAIGFTIKRTAEAMQLSPKTIESHRARLMAKLGIHDRVLLAHYALQSGLVPLTEVSLGVLRPCLLNPV